MKLLESTRFEALNSALCIELGDCKIFGRIESYSCKMAGGDKQMYKRFNSEQGMKPHDLQALSPPQTMLAVSPYSYNPDLASDPFGEEGSLWSFNYFFYNKKLKRVVFFTCRAINPVSAAYMDSGFGTDLSMEEDY
ncbi:hypothetical protein B566_EDAN005348 [Ephemera danica]|nr:hypothetical protein B566_EDAN005348 [Ephemera danica]